MRKIFTYISIYWAEIVCAIASWIPKGEFSKITFWKSENGKYLYYCMSEDHVTDENKFRKAFPQAHRISQTEFDLLIYFYPEKQVVEVADTGIADEPFEDDGAPYDDTND